MWRLGLLAVLFALGLTACSGGNDFPENPPPSDGGTTTTEPTNTDDATATDPQAEGGDTTGGDTTGGDTTGGDTTGGDTTGGDTTGGDTTGGGGGGGGGNNCHQHGNHNDDEDDDDDDEEEDERHNPCRTLSLSAPVGVQVFGGARGMDISGNAAGDAVAVWHEAGRVSAARLSKSGWSAPIVVAAQTDAVTSSQVRIDEDGSATLRWAYAQTPNVFFERRISPDNTLSDIGPASPTAALWPIATEARDGARVARLTQHTDGSIALEIYEPATGWSPVRVVAVGVPGTARLAFVGGSLMLGYVRAGAVQEAVLQRF